jgi:hypothetical protein
MFRLSHLKRCVDYHFHIQRAKRETSDIPETSIRLYIHKRDFVAAISWQLIIVDAVGRHQGNAPSQPLSAPQPHIQLRRWGGDQLIRAIDA